MPLGVSGSPTADLHCCGASPRFLPLDNGVHAADGYSGVMKVVEACAGDPAETVTPAKTSAAAVSKDEERMNAIYVTEEFRNPLTRIEHRVFIMIFVHALFEWSRNMPLGQMARFERALFYVVRPLGRAWR